MILVLIFMSMNTAALAETDMSGWRYTKDIQCEEGVAYQSIFLDDETYKYANKDLSDLRILNDNDEFVPYYIQNAYQAYEEETHIEYGTELITSYTMFDDKYFDYKIVAQEETHDILASDLVFNVGKEIFLRDVKVYGGYDNKAWNLIKSDTIYRTDGAVKLNIKLDEVYKYGYYRIVFLNDLEDTRIENLTLEYSVKDLVVDHYQKTKNLDFSVEALNKDTVLVIDNKNNLKLHTIKVVSDDMFKRSYQVEYKDNDEVDYRPVSGGNIYQIALANFDIEDTDIELEYVSKYYLSADTIRIMIINKDDKPIDIKALEVSYYIDKIVFEDEGEGSESYKMIFGNKDARAASYDIEEYKQYIEEEDRGVCTLSATKDRDVEITEDKTNYKLILNITVVVIALLLVGLIFFKSNFKDI
jgi:hypothetical protein